MTSLRNAGSKAGTREAIGRVSACGNPFTSETPGQQQELIHQAQIREQGEVSTVRGRKLSFATKRFEQSGER
jgi:hypothetical protein